MLFYKPLISFVVAFAASSVVAAANPVAGRKNVQAIEEPIYTSA